jgi:hypothetical protein
MRVAGTQARYQCEIKGILNIVRRMKKIVYLFKEAAYLIKEHRFYFIAPLLIMIVILALLAYYAGPTVILSFIYAGI